MPAFSTRKSILPAFNSLTAFAISKVTVLGGLPESFDLQQNYPNPFNPETTITFDLPTPEHVELSVYNLSGQLTTTLIDEDLSAGAHTITWLASDHTSGVYLVRLVAGPYRASQKAILAR